LTRHVFHLEVKPDKHDRLRELNSQYGEALQRVAGGIPGFGGVEKYVLGDDYIELVSFDGDFGDFGRQLAADPEVREFLRAVGDCFVGGLRVMPDRRMELLQTLVDEPATSEAA
jgi:hypothetical protein